jgi:hypothetical protein
MKKKISTAEHAELLLSKDKKYKSFYDMDTPLPFDPPGIKTRG